MRYADAEGTERVVSIVGADEVDLNLNHISWVSPLRRALMKAEEGHRVVLQAPGGSSYLTVLEVSYEHIAVEPFREPMGAESTAKHPPTPGHSAGRRLATTKPMGSCAFWKQPIFAATQ